MRIRDLARELRKRQTPAEIFFWAMVRNRGLLGLMINRQQIIRCLLDPSFTKFYVADFYCHQLQLIIELDGGIHEIMKNEDLVRTELMESYGYRVIRFSNDDVLYNWSEVENRIRQLLGSLETHPDPLL